MPRNGAWSYLKRCGHRRDYRCCCFDERPRNEESTLDVVDFMAKKRRTNMVTVQGWEPTNEEGAEWARG